MSVRVSAENKSINRRRSIKEDFVLIGRKWTRICCRGTTAAIGISICTLIPHVYQVRMKLEDCVHCPDVDVLGVARTDD